jgi:hypothetical protein
VPILNFGRHIDLLPALGNPERPRRVLARFTVVDELAPFGFDLSGN